MLGFPTDFEGIDNENRLDRQSRQCWEFWRENSRTELISWLLTHHDIRNKTDKKNLLYLCIPLGLWSTVCCCLWKRQPVAWWPFFERSRDRTVDKSRARHVFWNLWEIIIFFLKLRILFWVCALVDSTVWYILMWQDLIWTEIKPILRENISYSTLNSISFHLVYSKTTYQHNPRRNSTRSDEVNLHSHLK